MWTTIGIVILITIAIAINMIILCLPEYDIDEDVLMSVGAVDFLAGVALFLISIFINSNLLLLGIVLVIVGISVFVSATMDTGVLYCFYVWLKEVLKDKKKDEEENQQ